jgi:hypothetical protein
MDNFYKELKYLFNNDSNSVIKKKIIESFISFRRRNKDFELFQNDILEIEKKYKHSKITSYIDILIEKEIREIYKSQKTAKIL